jgi:hypothetical protein
MRIIIFFNYEFKKNLNLMLIQDIQDVKNICSLFFSRFHTKLKLKFLIFIYLFIYSYFNCIRSKTKNLSKPKLKFENCWYNRQYTMKQLKI